MPYPVPAGQELIEAQAKAEDFPFAGTALWATFDPANACEDRRAIIVYGWNTYGKHCIAIRVPAGFLEEALDGLRRAFPDDEKECP